MLVFSWYLVRERKKNQNMSFKNRAILFSRTFSCANHSNSRGLYIRAGALRENKTHAKITRTKVCCSLFSKKHDRSIPTNGSHP